MSDPVEIPVRSGGEVVTFALVDACDADVVRGRSWSLTDSGYAQSWQPNGSSISMHRLILGLQSGDGKIVHHKNETPLDNRRENFHVVGSTLEHQRLHHPNVPYRRLARAVAVAARREMVRTTHNRTQYLYGCRCDECRAANRATTKKLAGRTPPRHGNSGYMNYRCRCAICKAANSEYQRGVRERRKQAAA